MQQEKRAIKEELNQPKAFHTKREDCAKYCYSRGCPGCRALLTGTNKQKHAPQCRQRVEREMGDLKRVKAAKRRREEFLEKVTVAIDRQRHRRSREEVDFNSSSEAIDGGVHRDIPVIPFRFIHGTI